MGGPLRVQCPMCKEWLSVAARVDHVDETTNEAVVRLDREVGDQHLLVCAARQGDKAGKALAVRQPEHNPELAGRINVMLDGAYYIDRRASRACTMCGVNGDECLQRVRRSQKGCCPACENGDTHPVKDQRLTCAEWSEQHGAQN